MARTDAEWARDMDRRVTALERMNVLRMGNWTVTQGDNGELIALNDNGRSTVIAEREPSE